MHLIIRTMVWCGVLYSGVYPVQPSECKESRTKIDKLIDNARECTNEYYENRIEFAQYMQACAQIRQSRIDWGAHSACKKLERAYGVYMKCVTKDLPELEEK